MVIRTWTNKCIFIDISLDVERDKGRDVVLIAPAFVCLIA